jgi:hypothetical protein
VILLGVSVLKVHLRVLNGGVNMQHFLILLVAIYSLEFVSALAYIVSEVYINNRLGKSVVLSLGMAVSVLITSLYSYIQVF